MMSAPSSSVKTDDTLDLKGLKCPLPALLTKRAMLRSAYGRVIEVICDDPLAHLDVPHMCRHENIEVIDQQRDGDVVRFLLRRTEGAK